MKINCFNNLYFLSEPSSLSDELKTGISVTAVVCFALLITLVFFCILRKHKNKKDRARAGEKTNEDMNPVYGLYECDPDPQAEVEDTNDYYFEALYEEGIAITRDNNSKYESC